MVLCGPGKENMLWFLQVVSLNIAGLLVDLLILEYDICKLLLSDLDVLITNPYDTMAVCLFHYNDVA